MGDFHALSDTTIDPDGFHSASVDAYGEGEATSSPNESHHLHGFLSRPMAGVLDQASGEVDGANATQVLVLKYGHRSHAFNCEDPRTVPLLPQLQRGESLMYGSAWGQFVRCHADGSISLVTTSKPASDGTGQPLHLWIRPTGLEFVAPWGRLVFDQTGFHVKHISGASMGLGSLGGFPAPLDSIASHFSVQAGIVSHDATAVAAGPSQGVQQPVALAAPVLEALTAVQVALTSVQAALASALPVSGITAAQTSAVQVAVAALDVVLTGTTTTLPSPSLAG
jgi:hypothetical protein